MLESFAVVTTVIIAFFIFYQVLCHPSSVDSLSTSAAQEDHVSMVFRTVVYRLEVVPMFVTWFGYRFTQGGMSARKALVVVTNVEYVLAIELLSAVQVLPF